ncbi:hypothetical protein BGZ73_003392 [Actinomortierella ambigua]|nr:hypothetical protein BGZ73_003392 [Actinomortierella ambigua]
MAKKDKKQEGHVQNREIYSRMNFLYQAANYLATLPCKTTPPPPPPPPPPHTRITRWPRRKTCFSCGCPRPYRYSADKVGGTSSTSVAAGTASSTAVSAVAAHPVADDLIAQDTAASMTDSMDHAVDVATTTTTTTAAATIAAPPATKLNRKARRQLEREQLVQERQRWRQQQQQQQQQPTQPSISSQGEDQSSSPSTGATDDQSSSNSATETATSTRMAAAITESLVADSTKRRSKLKRHRNRLAYRLPSLRPPSLSLDSLSCSRVGKCDCHDNKPEALTADNEAVAPALLEGTAAAAAATTTQASLEDPMSVVISAGDTGAFKFSRAARFYTAALREIGRKTKPQLHTAVSCNACGTLRRYYCMPGRGIQGDRLGGPSATAEVTLPPPSKKQQQQPQQPSKKSSQSNPSHTAVVAGSSATTMEGLSTAVFSMSSMVTETPSPPVSVDSPSTVMELDQA